MKRLAPALLLIATAALADIPPENAAGCYDKQAGAACTTDDGAAGTCVETTVTRPDYSQGVPPKYVPTKMLLCEAGAASPVRKQAVDWRPWFGAALALVALLAALVTRGRRRLPA